MEYRQLGRSDFKVPALSFGTGTFGGRTDFFKAWGATDVAEARRLVDICLEAGITMFDSADIYSDGLSEEVLGKALAGSLELHTGDRQGAHKTAGSRTSSGLRGRLASKRRSADRRGSQTGRKRAA